LKLFSNKKEVMNINWSYSMCKSWWRLRIRL